MPNSTKLILIWLSLLLLGPAHAQNILRNGEFGQGNSYWQHLSNNGAVAHYSIVNGPGLGDSALQAQVTRLGTNAWDAQSIHDDQICDVNTVYTISLTARSAHANGRLRVVMQNTTYSAQDFRTTNSWTTYTLQLVAPETGLNFKIHWLDTGTYQVTGIRIVPNQPLPVPTLTDSMQRPATALGLGIGAALDPMLLGSDGVYQHVYNQQFNGLVAENVMKMAHIWTARNRYNFYAADSLVRYARRRNKQIRGHTLLWHSSVPQWLSSGNFPADTLRKLLKTYTQTVVSRYRGQIAEWDVVNEAISDLAPNNLRNHFVYNTLGPAILDSMFVWAHAADPAALLFYNDYSIEFTGPKANMMLSTLNNMRQRGIPVHGVGFQCHFDHNVPETFFTAVQTMVNRVASIGLKVSFTEVDFAIRTPIRVTDYSQQGHAYAQLLRIALNNSNTVKTFYLWGFTDQHSWIPSFWATRGIPKDEALPFDRSYQPKPAYDSLMAVLIQRMVMVRQDRSLDHNQPSIWPNPAKTEIYLPISPTTAADEVVLTSTTGQNWWMTLPQTQRLDISHLPRGLYQLQYAGRSWRFIRE